MLPEINGVNGSGATRMTILHSLAVMESIPRPLLNDERSEELDALVREWPRGIPLTDEAAKRLVQMGFDPIRFARRLGQSKRDEFKRLIAQDLAEYNRAMDKACATSVAKLEWDKYCLALTRVLFRLISTKGQPDAS